MQSTHLREHNLSAVLRALQTAPSPTSRAGLATLTRLTKPTVSKLVEELVGAGLVEEGEPVAAGAGRPMVPLRPASGTLLAIGLEIAADHISCLGTDLTGAELARRTTYHRVAEGTAEDALALAAQLVHEVRAGVPAPTPPRLSPEDGRILSAPGLDWADVPVVARLQELLAPAAWPVGAQNDNRLSVLTEIDRRPGESFLYVRGSTGVGGAVVLEGAVLEGAHGWAGEFGHTVVAPEGRRCRCGRRGCLEAYISYLSLVRQAGLSDDVRIEDLVDELARSSSRAEVIGVIGRSLGLAIANALNVLDLSTVVLSGYLAPIAEEIAPVVQETVDRHALAAEAGPVAIERADSLADPALHGAARAALQPVFDAPVTWIEKIEKEPA
jgi:predicted NBD/HSP70 family sugar kinase